jgi:hypothetical protein
VNLVIFIPLVLSDVSCYLTLELTIECVSFR